MASLSPKCRLNKQALCTKPVSKSGKTVAKQGIKAVCIYLICIATTLVVAGCGQKGNLYLPKDANPNTEFIIYKSNKPDANQVNKSNITPELADDINPNHPDNPFLDDLDDPNNY